MAIQTIEGTYQIPDGARFAIVAARWNEFIVDRLVDGALDTLRKHGVDDARISLVRVPGAFEIPVAAKQLIDAGGFSAIITLGCVIRGATAHFDYVSSAVTSGCSSLALTSGVPVVFGVLTTDTIEQAIERAGTKAGNKGSEAAAVAIEMASLAAAIGGGAGKAASVSIAGQATAGSSLSRKR
jgi:6,7-dimethyl-8-ribityllumazine synthase